MNAPSSSRPENPTPRVRVTAPPRRRKTTPLTRTGEIDSGTELGEVLLHSLMRDQRRLSLGVLLTVFVVVVPLPLLVRLVPALTDVQVFGLPITWVLLGACPFPLMLALGWWYVRRAEANERAFADLLHRDSP